MTETTRRIIAVKEKNGLNDRQLELGANLPPASLQAWRNGKKNKKGEMVEVSPSTDSIISVAKFFNVSADYFLCLSDEESPLNKAVPAEQPNNDIITIDDIELMLANNDGLDWIEKLYKELKDKQQRLFVLTWLIGYLASEGLPVKQILGK